MDKTVQGILRQNVGITEEKKYKKNIIEKI
jgi:hypothetical protein